MVNNPKIGLRFGIGFAVTLALLITIATISYLRLSATNSAMDDLVQDKFPKTVQAAQLQDLMSFFKIEQRHA